MTLRGRMTQLLGRIRKMEAANDELKAESRLRTLASRLTKIENRLKKLEG